MLSILFCSRVKENPASGLMRWFESLLATTTPAEREQIEILIKFDDDDDQRPPPHFFASLPLSVRTFVYSRGEGRHGLHHAQEYLFAQRDPRSRLLLLTADDFVFTRPGWVSDLLAVRDELVIMGYVRPHIERLAVGWDQPENHTAWITSFGEWSPIVSVRLIEICQNFGWQANVDSWLMALSLALYELYQIVLWKPHKPFYRRSGGYGLGDPRTYNNMEVTCQKGPHNRYWYELVRRQARNVYLNLEYGTALQRRRWLHPLRVAWRKFRSKPLLHLPLRLGQRLYRDFRIACGFEPLLRPVKLTAAMKYHQQTPYEYRTYRIWRSHGMYFGVPFALELSLSGTTDYLNHPQVPSAPTYEQLKDIIDQKCLLSETQTLFSATTLLADTSAPPSDPDATPVEFAGWLPAFRTFGNCGQHPQFRHIEQPPQGYRFTYSLPAELAESHRAASEAHAKAAAAVQAVERTGLEKLVGAVLVPWRSLVALATVAPGVSWADRCRTLWAAARLYHRCRAAGCSRVAALQFLYTRHLTSQYWQTAQVKNLAFLPSIPFTFNQTPWLIEIEDITTLFFPFAHNGQTCELNFRELPVYPAVKALLESEECRGIVTHIRSTAQMLPRLFQSEIIAQKVFYAPMGVPVPPEVSRPRRRPDEPIELLFTNSWNQGQVNFLLRGGLDVLEAFRLLKPRYPQLRLTLRSALPELHRHYQRILVHEHVRIIDRKITDQEMRQLHDQADIYLLPSARIHIVSLLQAMAHGLPVVVSDGWGFEEYIDDGRNGLVVPGRYGVASWADDEAGVLREDYHTLYSPEPRVVAGLVQAISRLIDDPETRLRIGQQARLDVQRYYHLDRWNAALKQALDRATGKISPTPEASQPRRESTPQLATSDV